jgi:hypothetical protein
MKRLIATSLSIMLLFVASNPPNAQTISKFISSRLIEA